MLYTSAHHLDAGDVAECVLSLPTVLVWPLMSSAKQNKTSNSLLKPLLSTEQRHMRKLFYDGIAGFFIASLQISQNLI